MLIRLLQSLWYHTTIQMMIISVPLKYQRENHSEIMDHLLALYLLNQLLSNHQRNIQREHNWRKLQRESPQDVPYANVIKSIS